MRVYSGNGELLVVHSIGDLLEHKKLQQGKVSGISSTELTEDGRRTPTLWDTVKVHCKVSFNHIIYPTPTTLKTDCFDRSIALGGVGPMSNRITNPTQTTHKTIVGGRVDHGIGIVIRSPKVPNRRFY